MKKETQAICLDEWNEIPDQMRPGIRYWLPEAAVDKEDLTMELKDLRARGFGRVEIVSLGNAPETIVRGEDRWGADSWDRMISHICHVSRELGLRVDIANGPKWPIAMPALRHADDTGTLRELVFGYTRCEKGQIYEGPVPENPRRKKEGTSRLVSVAAWSVNEEGKLITGSFQDLTGLVRGTGDQLDIRHHFLRDGILFAFYAQPSAQRVSAEQYLVADHLSDAGVAACEDYWSGFFRKCPESSGTLESLFCDSLEYEVCLDWTESLPEAFEARRGYSLLPWLPFIGHVDTYPQSLPAGFDSDTEGLAQMIHHDYCEVLTQLYCEKHLTGLEKMAETFGKTIRYQVAYNKLFEVERSALHVSVPENEALGRPAMDCLKTMAAAAHLGRKSRYSFECAAVFGNAYGQDYEDLFWWVRRSLMAGMNAQVLHGASYSGGYHGRDAEKGQIPGAVWPGYEGFGKLVSNYWNRTPSVADARGCMDAIARLNVIFRKQARVDCAIYRASYLNSGLESEFCFYPDDGLLSSLGYSYETVSPELMELPVFQVKNGMADPEGTGYRCLIIPEQKAVSGRFLRRLHELMNQKFPVIWVGQRPTHSLFYSEWMKEDAVQQWQTELERVWEHPEWHHADSLEAVPGVLSGLGIFPGVVLEGGRDMVTATRLDPSGGRRFYALYTLNRVVCSPESPNDTELSCSAAFRKGTTKSSYIRPGISSAAPVFLRLLGEGTVYRCHYWDGKLEKVNFRYHEGYMEGTVVMEEDELVVFCLAEEEIQGAGESSGDFRLSARLDIRFRTLELRAFGPDTPEEVSFIRSSFSDTSETIALEKLLPWRMVSERFAEFSGQGTYHAVFSLENVDADARYVLQLGEVCDTFRVWINGQEASFPDQVCKRADITELVRNGENHCVIVVTSNLYNRLVRKGLRHRGRVDIPFSPKDYGIWETDEKRCFIGVYRKERF